MAIFGLLGSLCLNSWGNMQRIKKYIFSIWPYYVAGQMSSHCCIYCIINTNGIRGDAKYMKVTVKSDLC